MPSPSSRRSGRVSPRGNHTTGANKPSSTNSINAKPVMVTAENAAKATEELKLKELQTKTQNHFDNFMTAVNDNISKKKFFNGYPKPVIMTVLKENQVGLYIKNLIVYQIIEFEYKNSGEAIKLKLDRLFFTDESQDYFDFGHWFIFNEVTHPGTIRRVSSSIRGREPYNLEINSTILSVLKDKVKEYIKKIMTSPRKKNKVEEKNAVSTFKAIINTLGKQTREGAALVEQETEKLRVANLPDTVNLLSFQLEQLLKDMPRGETDLDRRLRLLLEYRKRKQGGSRRSKRTRKNRKIRL